MKGYLHLCNKQKVIQGKILFYCYRDNDVEVHRREKMRFSKRRRRSRRVLGEKKGTYFDQSPETWELFKYELCEALE